MMLHFLFALLLLKIKSHFIGIKLNLIYSLTDINDNISYNLVQSFCIIAIFDWPQDYPNFFEIFDDFETSEKTMVSVRILSSFLNEIDNTDIITDNHRNELRQLFAEQYLEQIKIVINNYLLIPEYSNDLLIICNCFIRWYLLRNFLNLELFDQIIRLLGNDFTFEKSIECIKSIFINNEGDEEILCTYSPVLVQSLPEFILNDKIPISNDNFVCFLIDFLQGYGHCYMSALEFDQISKYEQKFLRNRIIKLVKSWNDYSIENDVIKNNLIILYKTVYNFSFDDITDEFRESYLNLFSNIFDKIYDESKNYRIVKEYTQFFKSIYDEMFQSIYKYQSFFDYYESECTNTMRSILCNMYSINPDYYINFLSEQPPTPQLCYSIGSIQNFIVKSQQKMFISILSNLVDYLENDQSFEFLSSLLYALSKCTSCLYLDNQLFKNFNQLIFNSLTKNDEKLLLCASSSFYEVVMNNIGLYKNDCLQFIELIANNCCEFLSNMDKKSSEKMIIACTKLIRYFKYLVNQSKTEEMTNFDHIALYQKLFDPFIEILNNIDDSQIEIIETSFNIIGKVCIISKDTETDLINIIWPHLIQLAYNVIPDSSISSKLIELVLNTIVKIQVNFEYEEISSQIEEIFNLMTQRGKIEDCFFIYFARLKLCFNEIGEIYDQIHQQIALPFISQEGFESSEMFKMIDKFDFNTIDIEWFTCILIETIRNMSTDVVYTALNSYILIIRKISGCQSVNSFFENFAPELIKTIIEAIFDLLHKLLLLKFCEVLNEFIHKINNDNCCEYDEYFEEEEEENNEYSCLIDHLISIIKNSISEKLLEIVPGPEDDLYNNFVEYLFKQNSTSDTSKAFTNLLIMLRKASPCDFDYFKEKQIDNFPEDDYNAYMDVFIDDINSRNYE